MTDAPVKLGIEKIESQHHRNHKYCPTRIHQLFYLWSLALGAVLNNLLIHSPITSLGFERISQLLGLITTLPQRFKFQSRR